MINKLRKEITEYFIGKEEVVKNVLICLLAGGHVLLEDVPGVGKTTLAKTIAGSVDCSFGRIQFTPDTLPGDVVGVSVYNPKTKEFEYREGAVMRQFILADEINRTSPKTQASLLEAMAEGSVTVDGIRHDLPQPFMVIATQNPIEFLGTYPLPEAQMDRFMMKLSIGYPDAREEKRLARMYAEGRMDEPVRNVITAEELIGLREETRRVHISDAVLGYIQEIVELTRKEERFVLGASTRATLFMVSASRACAKLEDRDYVKPDDVQQLAVNLLHHRLVLTSEAMLSHDNVDQILNDLIRRVPVPRE
ncbi:MAG: MoxR family ATPase [Solobacterium sp.]|nr:MoxR family ATPase [Solobacterium sp.]